MSGRAAYRVAGTLAANLLILAVNFVTGTLSARLLGPAGRGELSAIQTLPAMLGTLGLAGLPSAIAFYTTREPGQARRILRTGTLLTLALAVPTVGVGLLVVPWILGNQSRDVVKAACVYLAFIPLQAIQFPAVTSAWGLQRFRLWNVVRALPALSWLVAVLGAAWLFGAAASSMALTYVGIFGLVSIGTFALVARFGDDTAENEGSGAGPRDLLAYGLPSALATIPAMANHRLDQVLMAAWIPAGQLGIYAVAASWGALVQPVLSAIASVAFPKVAAQEKPSHETLGRISRSAIVVALVMGGALAAVTPVLLPALFGDPFRGAVAAALLLVAASMVAGVNGVLEELLRGLGAPRWPLYAHLLGAGVTVVALLALLAPYGIVGGAVATLLACGTMTVVLTAGVTAVAGMRAVRLVSVEWRDIEILASRTVSLLRRHPEDLPEEPR